MKWDWIWKQILAWLWCSENKQKDKGSKVTAAQRERNLCTALCTAVVDPLQLTL